MKEPDEMLTAMNASAIAIALIALAAHHWARNFDACMIGVIAVNSVRPMVAAWVSWRGGA